MPQVYSDVKKEVDEFIKRNPDLNKAFNDGLAQVDQVDKDAKNMYLLAFMQNVINSKYPAVAGGFLKEKDSVNGGIHWLNSVIDDILVKEGFSAEAQKYITSVAIDTLLRVTNQDRIFDKNFLKLDLYKNKIAERLNNNHPFPADLHHSIEFKFKDNEYYSPTKVKYTIDEKTRADVLKTRADLLKDLTDKLPSYQSKLEDMIPAHWQYSERDLKAARKLILREAATIFLQGAISSGVELNSREVRDRVNQLFGPLALESRWLEKEEYSHLSKKINELSMPAFPGASLSAVGLYKPSQRDDKQVAAQTPVFTLR